MPSWAPAALGRSGTCPTKQHSRNQTPATAGGDRRTACPTKKSSQEVRVSTRQAGGPRHIGIPKKEVRPIDDHFGFSGGMAGFERLYKDGKLAVVRGQLSTSAL